MVIFIVAQRRLAWTKMLPLLAFLALNALCPMQCVSWGQENSSKRIDRYIAAEMQSEKVPGVAIGIYDHGRTQEYLHGLANVELDAAVNRDTVFESGSVGKEFVAVATMILVERRELNLSDSISKYLPDAPASWKPVKIEHLLSHTSGLGDFSSLALTSRGQPFDYQKDLSQEELLTRLYALPTVFAPASDWRYNNTNYVLLGIVLEKISGRKWGQLLRDLIFSPLQMTSARIVGEHDIIPHRAAGYLLEDGIKNQNWTAPTWNGLADGSIELSLADLERWNAALLTRKLLNQSSFFKMWSVYPLATGKPNSGGYGFGFFIRDVKGHRLVEHDGAWQGFSTYAGLFVDDGIGVAVLTNLASPPARPADFGLGAVGLDDPRLTPPDVLPIKDPDPKLSATLRRRVDEFIQGKSNPLDYAPEMHSNAEEDAALQAMFQAQGPIFGFELVSRSFKDGRSELHYRVRTPKRIFIFSFVLNEAGQIAQIGLSS